MEESQVYLSTFSLGASFNLRLAPLTSLVAFSSEEGATPPLAPPCHRANLTPSHRLGEHTLTAPRATSAGTVPWLRLQGTSFRDSLSGSPLGIAIKARRTV